MAAFESTPVVEDILRQCRSGLSGQGVNCQVEGFVWAAGMSPFEYLVPALAGTKYSNGALPIEQTQISSRLLYSHRCVVVEWASQVASQLATDGGSATPDEIRYHRFD